MAMAMKQAFSRLPNVVKPKHYTLRLKPDLEKFTFKGWLQVDLEVVTPTKSVVCNAADLSIVSAQIVFSREQQRQKLELAAEQIILNENDETLTLQLDEELPLGPANLLCHFTGVLPGDRMRGLYRSKYTSAEGEERYCAVTQFESTDARRCFPCWDEPSRKATFSMSVVAPRDRVVLSNMPEVGDAPLSDELSQLLAAGGADGEADGEADGDAASSSSSSGCRLVTFDRTPVMSTYLLALVVGEHECVEARTKDGVLVRAFSPPGKREQGRFALETSVRALEYYTDYFSLSYPLPKYDLIAISDFEAGAMENWGLVTFRESCILNDPANSSAASRQTVALVVNHEMAHQWFGNLVTMEWWTHLWLNEGFASFIESRCTDHLFPEFDFRAQTVADSLIPALELDALNSSHPIEVEVGHPSEVDEIFDNISYNKGSSIIHMLHNFIGDDAFRRGMNLYLKKYSYANAVTADLWQSLEEASSKNVGAVMNTWTSQMGFPVVTVEAVKCDEAGGKAVLSLTQEKFSADGSRTPDMLWKIPIEAITASGRTASFVMEEKSAEFAIETDSPDDWVKLNHDFVGVYRVQYAPEYLHRFHPAITNKTLSPVNRLSIINDLVALVQSGRVSSDIALTLFKACKQEDAYVVWTTIVDFMNKLSILVYDEDYFSQFKSFSVDLLSDVAQSLGWSAKESEHHTQGLLRMLVLSRIGQYGHEATVAEAKRLFQDHIKKVKPIPADLRTPVYRIVASNATDETFNQLITLYKTSELNEEKDRIGRAMGAATDRNILLKVLAFAFSEDVRAQDSPFVMLSVARNPAGRDLAWQYFKDNFGMLDKRYKGGMLMTRILSGMENFATLEQADDMQAFLDSHPVQAKRAINQAIENVRLNAAWLAKDSAKLSEFFQNI